MALLRSDFAYRSVLGRATGQLPGPMRLSLTLVRGWLFRSRRRCVLWRMPIRSADLPLCRMPRFYLCLELAVPYCTYPSIKEKSSILCGFPKILPPLLPSCCENALEFRQIDDIRWLEIVHSVLLNGRKQRMKIAIRITPVQSNVSI